MTYSYQFTLKVPAPVGSVSFAGGSLAVGSDDGTLRFYELPSTRVTKAIRGFKHDISSVQWMQNGSTGQDPAQVWVASGPTAYAFKLDPLKMILSESDASAKQTLGEDDEDVLNELHISENKKYMSFSTDGGTVGVVDLTNNQVSRMRVSHTTICSSVKFVPGRPNELVSGGYDSAILHFDFKQGNILSRFDIASAPPTSGVSLSPPFILSTSISATGLVAATTADGRIWLGSGGDKSSPLAKKKSRKWEGLREADGLFHQVADGPVVCSAFTAPTSLLTCTLLGRIAVHTVSYDESQKVRLETQWTGNTVNVTKVNALHASDGWIAIGGFTEDGGGLVELWKLSEVDTLSQGVAELAV
ncbi:hypothetical protein BDW22DRAFT_1427012 [Trametopsis cervina]|nr:hypothetical protein BDW22DRAFT_1427012 [Trametopsis cervina]